MAPAPPLTSIKEVNPVSNPNKPVVAPAPPSVASPTDSSPKTETQEESTRQQLLGEGDKTIPHEDQEKAKALRQQLLGEGDKTIPQRLGTDIFPKPTKKQIGDRKPCRGSIKYLIKHPYCRVPKWLKDAKTEGETVFIDSKGKITWEKGTWKLGVWRGDIWKDGLWKGGTFYSGIWEGGTWLTGDWRGYIWHGGTWEKGEWQLGIWKGGTFKDGMFRRGIWRDGKWWGTNMTASLWEQGTWHKGGFVRSLWMNGTWYGEAESFRNNSIWTDSLWKYGYWYGGDFNSGIWENGIWHDGEFHEGVWENGIWRGGLWWELSDSLWKCGIWAGGQWGWPAWMATHDRENKADCDLSKAGVPPIFLTQEQSYTFIPEEQIYRCSHCPSPEKKVYYLKPAC